MRTKINRKGAKEMYDLLLSKYKDNANFSIIGDRSARVKDLKCLLDIKNNKIIWTFKKFNKIINAYNLKAGDCIIQGEYFYLGHPNLGYIHAKRIERNPMNPTIKKKESFEKRKELKEKGQLTKHNWKVFHEEPDYCRIGWSFRSSPNRTVYSFAPSKNSRGTGLSNRFSDQLKAKAVLKLNYPFYPLQKGFQLCK